MGKQVKGAGIILDNYEELKPFIKFEDQDTFYFLEVLKRRKDNPELKHQTAKLYSRFITKPESLERAYLDVKVICESENARAYLSILPRSLERFTKECALEFTRRVCEGVYSSSYKIPDEIALISKTVKKDNNMWLLDIDENPGEVLEYLKDKVEILGKVETFSGIHAFCKPFNYPLIFKDLEKLEDDNFKMNSGTCFGIKKSALSILYAYKRVD